MEYGLDLLKRCLCFARRNPENLFFSEDDCHVIGGARVAQW